jgi:hypothetical protein
LSNNYGAVGRSDERIGKVIASVTLKKYKTAKVFEIQIIKILLLKKQII